jgi:hypothetical protein
MKDENPKSKFQRAHKGSITSESTGPLMASRRSPEKSRRDNPPETMIDNLESLNYRSYQTGSTDKLAGKHMR